MTAPRPLSDKALREAATVAAETGVTVVIEVGGRVYKLLPPGADYPLTASEKDAAACDEAFGLSR